MAQNPAERQTKLASLFEETLRKDEYASLLRGEPSVQEYLAAGKRLSFESILPLVTIPGLADFGPDQRNCYWSAIQKAFASDEETVWQQIVEDTAAEIDDYRLRKTGALLRVAELLGAEFVENVTPLQLSLGKLLYSSSLVAGALSLLTERKEIQTLEGEIEDKETEIRGIQEARSTLTTLRDSNLKSISADIILVDEFWQRMKEDSFALLDYVEAVQL
ncbi:uncharacterized protein LDX57_004313 [Aspergillus melleus]|uniref:uncharacterized protein n=1 Tax=Aspergillus melleus TaxID=138277 RepID=UPI001E8DCD5D|nr:uncharacterized protein LDX57_004313 [Aspergillus melleus]KAH8426576.1 hypothetical protein LDX57_004313 [Aspergillus melleus]